MDMLPPNSWKLHQCSIIDAIGSQRGKFCSVDRICNVSLIFQKKIIISYQSMISLVSIVISDSEVPVGFYAIYQQDKKKNTKKEVGYRKRERFFFVHIKTFQDLRFFAMISL